MPLIGLNWTWNLAQLPSILPLSVLISQGWTCPRDPVHLSTLLPAPTTWWLSLSLLLLPFVWVFAHLCLDLQRLSKRGCKEPGQQACGQKLRWKGRLQNPVQLLSSTSGLLCTLWFVVQGSLAPFELERPTSTSGLFPDSLKIPSPILSHQLGKEKSTAQPWEFLSQNCRSNDVRHEDGGVRQPRFVYPWLAYTGPTVASAFQRSVCDPSDVSRGRDPPCSSGGLSPPVSFGEWCNSRGRRLGWAFGHLGGAWGRGGRRGDRERCWPPSGRRFGGLCSRCGERDVGVQSRCTFCLDPYVSGQMLRRFFHHPLR